MTRHSRGQREWDDPKARASFTVVATAAALQHQDGGRAHYRTRVVNGERGPTGRIATARSFNAAPMAGKISSATEFRTNTVPSDTAISSSLAL